MLRVCNGTRVAIHSGGSCVLLPGSRIARQPKERSPRIAIGINAGQGAASEDFVIPTRRSRPAGILRGRDGVLPPMPLPYIPEIRSQMSEIRDQRSRDRSDL